MAKNVKFVLNRAAFQRQILMGAGTAAILEAAARAVAPASAEIRVSTSNNARKGGRVRVRIFDGSSSALHNEANGGGLASSLGRVNV